MGPSENDHVEKGRRSGRRIDGVRFDHATHAHDMNDILKLANRSAQGPDSIAEVRPEGDEDRGDALVWRNRGTAHPRNRATSNRH